VRQACYVLLSQKRALRQKDTACDQQMRLLRDMFLPEGNLLPPSLHLMEKVAGCRVPDDYSFHVCPCDGHSWDHLPRSEWPLHSEDNCPACGLSRFVTSVDTGLPIKPCQLRSSKSRFACFHHICASAAMQYEQYENADVLVNKTLCASYYAAVDRRSSFTLALKK